mgnify:CR=1 FL=1
MPAGHVCPTHTTAATLPPTACPQFKNKSGKVFKMSYPCAMLNVMVAEHNTNDQFAVGGAAGTSWLRFAAAVKGGSLQW